MLFPIRCSPQKPDYTHFSRVVVGDLYYRVASLCTVRYSLICTSEPCSLLPCGETLQSLTMIYRWRSFHKLRICLFRNAFCTIKRHPCVDRPRFMHSDCCMAISGIMVRLGSGTRVRRGVIAEKIDCECFQLRSSSTGFVEVSLETL